MQAVLQQSENVAVCMKSTLETYILSVELSALI